MSAPNINVFITKNKIYIKPTKAVTKPSIELSLKGNVENDVMPSTARFKRLK